MLSLLKTIGISILSLSFVSSSQAQPQESCSILSLSGGGSFGAVEVGIMEQELKTNSKFPKHFDIIGGISAGGLNAGFLTLNNSIQALKEVYTNLQTRDIYQKTYRPWSLWSWYDTTPLQQTIQEQIEKRKQYIPSINPSIKSPPITLIGSTNLNRKQLELHTLYPTDTKEYITNVLMATSAIPILFPPRMFMNEYHVDGGVVTNALITELLSFKKCKSYDIHVIHANHKKQYIQEISSLSSYLKSIIHVLYETFDDELAYIDTTSCMFSNKRLTLYFPNSTMLNQYSILDFSHGKELIDIGNQHYIKEEGYMC